MTISVLPDILTDILEEEPIAPEKLNYLQARVKLRLHNFILRHFAMAEDTEQLDQAKIARRLGQSRSRISQQLGVPGNWTIDSVTKLAAAIGGEIDFLWLPFPEPQPSDASEKTVAAMTEQIMKSQKTVAPKLPIASTPPTSLQRNTPHAGPPK